MSSGAPRHRLGSRWPPGTILRRSVAGLLVVSMVWCSWSIGGALTAPGTDSTAARLAEWGRSHSLGWAVTGLERVTYTVDKPKIGGSLPGGIPSVTGASDNSATTSRRRGSQPDRSNQAAAGVRSPAPIRPPARHRLANEGQWQDLFWVHGAAAAKVAFVRPDSSHTSYLADAIWMNPKLVSFRLFPGIRYPGQPKTGPDRLTGSLRQRVLATFNSGFQLKDSNGGFWQAGKATQPLVAGAASMVFTTDGRLRIEAWPGGVPGPHIAAVRQNLTMMITHGHVSSLVTRPHGNSWGRTVGNTAYVWRSGIGIRRDGTVVFVLGPALSIRTLADLLQRAGAVDAMELDINQDWTSYFIYTHPTAGSAVPHRIGNDTHPNLYRYLKSSSRDFVGVFPR